MKQMKAIITILTLFLAHSESLPVTSKALENNSDQLFWQTAWYAQAEGRKGGSPFIGDSRKITAKSIFITPNFNQNTSACPAGFKIDDNGKCIKVVSINQDDLLVTRLQNFFPQHQTTDDSTSIDYDYSSEDDGGATHFNLPLIPIINDGEKITSQESPQLNFTNNESFHDRYNAQDFKIITSSVAPILFNNSLINVTNSNETENSMEKTVADENSRNETWNRNETRVNESDINSDQGDTTTTVDADTTSEFSLFEDQFGDESNYTMTTTVARDEFVINELEKPQPEKTISSDTIASNLGDYFDAMLLNDSLLIDDSFSNENTTDSEFDATTVEDFIESTTEDESFTELSSGEKALTELLNERALEDILTKLKASEEFENSVKASAELLSSEKASSELSGLPPDISTFNNFAPTFENFPPELLSSQKTSEELFSSSEFPPDVKSSSQASTDESSELYLNKEAFPAILNSQKPSSIENSFTRFATVEKSSSRPSIVNGPFLIFGEPFSRPSTVVKSSQEISSIEKVFPESSSKASKVLVSSPKPFSVDSSEYSTFKTREHENVEFSTVNSVIPSVVHNFTTHEKIPKYKPETLTETSTKKKDFNLPIITTESATSTQILPQFTPNLFPYENRIIKDDSELENAEESNKFVYHHLASTEVSSTPPGVRFPMFNEQRVRFPDEPSPKYPPTSFSWPRDNGGLMRFWQDQPLINDYKIFSRSNSRGSGGNFHRRMSYRRN